MNIIGGLLVLLLGGLALWADDRIAKRLEEQRREKEMAELEMNCNCNGVNRDSCGYCRELTEMRNHPKKGHTEPRVVVRDRTNKDDRDLILRTFD